MSTIDPGATGSILQNFRLIERASASVWKAEDVRTSKTVAVKFLSKGLPKDPARRDALVRDVRLNAAIFHSFIVGIQEVAAAGDSLLLVMEWIDGGSIANRVKGKPLGREEFFRITYQIAEALKLLHAKNIVHGNVAGDSILVLPSGQAKLAGFNLGNIMPKQGQPSQFQQKGNDARAVAYMAPEQITNQELTPATDVFSFGLVMYEAATGRLPFQAATAADVAHKIVQEQPPSPKSLNPNIDNAVLSVMGGCVFKDAFKRLKDGKAVVDAITRVEPDAAKFAAGIAKSAAAPAGGTASAPAGSKNVILFIADVANYDEVNATDPADAAKSAARMQQILGEAVYLFDGKVLDPFGPRLIAELSSVDQAIEAGRKGEFDFSQEQQTGEVIPVRMLLHAGEIQERDGKVTGPAIDKAIEVLKNLPPLTLHVTEAFARRGKAQVRYRDAGAKAGVKLATIVPPEPRVEHDTELKTKLAEEEAAAEAAAAEAAAVAAQKQKRQRMLIIAAVVAIVVIGGGAAALFMRPKATAVHVEAPKAPTGPAPATAATPRNVALSVTAADPTIADKANAIRMVASEILKSYPEVRLSDASAQYAIVVSAQLRPAAPAAGVAAASTAASGTAAPGTAATGTTASGTAATGTAAPEIVVGSAPPAPAPDIASGVQPILQTIAAQLHIPMRGAATAEAYNAFADAVAAEAANDAVKEDASIRAATKADPNFLAAQILAMRFFTAQKKPVDALDAARHVFAAEPDNLDAARMVARTSLSTGDLVSAFGGYGAIVRKNPNDVEALNAIGKYAVAVSDIQKLNAVLRHLASAPAQAEVHEPDVLLAAGRIDQAVDKYYAAEERAPNNASLALKIGRIAVLRHSTPMAETELKKLQDADPLYGAHILKAYIAAAANNNAAAGDELKAASAASTPGDDFWTASAEVAAIGGNPPGVIDALERAAQRKEPSAAYILNDPLFSYLANDPRFEKVRESLLAEQTEIRTAMAAVSL